MEVAVEHIFQHLLVDASRQEQDLQQRIASTHGRAQFTSFNAEVFSHLFQLSALISQFGVVLTLTRSVFISTVTLIAQAIATPLANIDSITMYGDGNTAKLTGDITTTVKQVTNGIKDATGIDPMAFLAGMLGGKIGSADEL